MSSDRENSKFGCSTLECSVSMACWDEHDGHLQGELLVDLRVGRKGRIRRPDVVDAIVKGDAEECLLIGYRHRKTLYPKHCKTLQPLFLYGKSNATDL